MYEKLEDVKYKEMKELPDHILKKGTRQIKNGLKSSNKNADNYKVELKEHRT